MFHCTDEEDGCYSMDWSFIELIATYQKRVLALERETMFEFEDNHFDEAVVSPSYRNLDQPQYFYVAEIRKDLNPFSPFPSGMFRKVHVECYVAIRMRKEVGGGV